MPTLRIRQIAVALALAAFIACSGSGGSGPSQPPPPPQPSFSLSVSPSTLNIPAGSEGSAIVTVVRTGGFTDAITLSLDGPPPGVQGSGLVAANALTGPLSLLVAANVAPQSLDSLRVKGTAGALAQTTTLRLVIVPALPVGQISTDLVQASGGTQRAGAMENTGVALEPTVASTSKDATGTVEVRHGFIPSAKSN